jgi:hypothetical protein
VEEKRDLEEATVEEEVAMEEEEGMAAEEPEVEAEDTAVGAAVATAGEADTAAKAAEEASNAIGALYPWRRARKSTLRLILLVEEATESPVSTTLSYSSQEPTPATRSKYE